MAGNVRWVGLIGLVVVGFLVVPCDAAVTWSLVNDFSGAANTETSTWSYRYQANGSPNNLARDGDYELLPTFFPLDHLPFTPGPTPSYWNTADSPPYIGKNTTAFEQTVFTPFGDLTVPIDAVHSHPGQWQLVVASWLAPADMIVHLSYRFADAHAASNVDGIAWYVDLNTVSLDSGVIDEGGDTGLLSLTDVHVVPGDRIHFVVSPGEKGDYQCDSTLMEATVSAVPEPSSVVIVASLFGISFLAFRLRRRRDR